MKFRTEIGEVCGRRRIGHGDWLVLLGSCFTDGVGERLVRDGFSAVHNPLGPLYNPASIAAAIDDVLGSGAVDERTVVEDAEGVAHCLLYAAPRGYDLDERRRLLGAELRRASTVIITLGTAYVFCHNERDFIVGNCHRFPAADFTRRRMTVDEVAESLRHIMRALPEGVRQVIFTISPIRHLADGLHGNNLSKATLQLAVDEVLADDEFAGRAEYFPAYEALIDDLRDYRFYAADMKHPSEMAVDYIYSLFAGAYFRPTDLAAIESACAASLRAAHRPLNK